LGKVIARVHYQTLDIMAIYHQIIPRVEREGKEDEKQGYKPD
jgi:hypothetical protein